MEILLRRTCLQLNITNSVGQDSMDCVCTMMTFSALLPLVAWALFLGFLKSRGFGWRTAFLATAVLWGVSVTLLTELLSLFAALNRPWLAWGGGALSLVSVVRC